MRVMEIPPFPRTIEIRDLEGHQNALEPDGCHVVCAINRAGWIYVLAK
jgi:hypothetical protein